MITILKKYHAAALLLVVAPAAMITSAGCTKYLDAKPNQSFTEPQTLSDLQALLDYYPTMNTKDPAAGEISTTDYFVTDASYQSLSTDYFRNMYTWQPDDLFPPSVNDWANAYKAIYAANTVLGATGAISPAHTADWNNAEGEALVFRAKGFIQVAAIWSPAYTSGNAGTNLGIPLRLSTDFNIASVRASVAATYNQAIADLQAAVPLLPVSPVTPLRPSRPAAFGLLARIYLWMGNYMQAGLYADSCLQLKSALMNYSQQSAAVRYPFPRFNPEVIFESYIAPQGPIVPSVLLTDTVLYASYAANDLRQSLFFKSAGNGYMTFRGSYEGGTTFFSGVATDEMYLVRAEAFARAGNTAAAMTDLNTLLKNRYDNTFTGLAAGSSGQALALILAERRKELLYRGLRWMDIKRLNRDGAGIVQTRSALGQHYVLPANDLRYALPIPDDVIALTGMPQNPR
jgi:tetratricopeptide (TPR) repeat protein